MKWGNLKAELQTYNAIKRNDNRQVRDIEKTDKFGIEEIIRGLIPRSIYHRIRKVTSSQTIAKEIIIDAFDRLKRYKWEEWKGRCKRFLLWEENNNIDEKEKNKKGGRTFTDFDYLERKKMSTENSKKIVNNIITNVYKNNSNILNNLIFCIDSVLTVVNQ